jgi:hypothetical protein
MFYGLKEERENKFFSTKIGVKCTKAFHIYIWKNVSMEQFQLIIRSKAALKMSSISIKVYFTLKFDEKEK